MDSETPKTNPTDVIDVKSGLGMLAFGFGVAANVFVVLVSLPLFAVPYGSSIRPMGWTLWVFLIAVGTLLVVIPLSIVGSVKNKTNRWANWGILLSLLPFPLAIVLLILAMCVCGLTLEQ